MAECIKTLYSSHEACVSVNGRLSELFNISIGLKQGDVLSPVLFDIFINDLLDELRESRCGVELSTSRGTTTKPIPGLLWADDLVLIAKSSEELQKALRCVDKWMTSFQLEIGHEKCCVVPFPVVQDSDFVSELGQEEFSCQGGKIKVSDSYTYLGIVFQSDLTWKKQRKSLCPKQGTSYRLFFLFWAA